MSKIRVTRTTTATPETCWAFISDFANIDVFNPHLSKSALLPGSSATGVGAKRQCDMKDGKNFIRERINEWKEGESFTVDIYEGSIPVDHVVAKIGVTPQGRGGALLYMDYSYTPRMGYLGRLLDVLMIKRTFAKLLKGVLDGLAEKSEERDAQFKAA